MAIAPYVFFLSSLSYTLLPENQWNKLKKAVTGIIYGFIVQTWKILRGFVLFIYIIIKILLIFLLLLVVFCITFMMSIIFQACWEDQLLAREGLSSIGQIQDALTFFDLEPDILDPGFFWEGRKYSFLVDNGFLRVFFFCIACTFGIGIVLVILRLVLLCLYFIYSNANTILFKILLFTFTMAAGAEFFIVNDNSFYDCWLFFSSL